jgi:hypothetical protein
MKSFVVAVSVAHIACASAEVREKQRNEQFIGIELVNATIGPSKFSGAKWDGYGQVSTDVAAALATALTMPEPNAVIAMLASSFATRPFEAPDVFGVACVFSGATCIEKRPLASREHSRQDTLTPQFRASWHRVELRPGVSVRVRLVDADVAEHDLIADAEIPFAELEAALRSGSVYQVNVADQTQNQLLFLGIRVWSIDQSPAHSLPNREQP